jgi:undecaprenyl diphosphate synthase
MNEKIDHEIERLKGNSRLPGHIAIIMDGNGRWASKRNLPRLAGHREGRESVRAVVRTCARLGISYLSLFTFSLENWKRPDTEVSGLMHFLKDVLYSEYLELNQNNIRLEAAGRLDLLPEPTLEALRETMGKLSGNDGMVLNLCISYGGRAEIVDAAVRIVKSVLAGDVTIDSIDQNSFREYLYRPDIPDPDLLIRTSGEKRISNFLLWQIAYSEILVTDVLWPEFREKELIEAIREYLTRERRFGRVSSEEKDNN